MKTYGFHIFFRTVRSPTYNGGATISWIDPEDEIKYATFNPKFDETAVKIGLVDSDINSVILVVSCKKSEPCKNEDSIVSQSFSEWLVSQTTAPTITKESMNDEKMTYYQIPDKKLGFKQDENIVLPYAWIMIWIGIAICFIWIRFWIKS